MCDNNRNDYVTKKGIAVNIAPKIRIEQRNNNSNKVGNENGVNNNKYQSIIKKD
jgi:hypothetical protein